MGNTEAEKITLAIQLGQSAAKLMDIAEGLNERAGGDLLVGLARAMAERAERLLGAPEGLPGDAEFE